MPSRPPPANLKMKILLLIRNRAEQAVRITRQKPLLLGNQELTEGLPDEYKISIFRELRALRQLCVLEFKVKVKGHGAEYEFYFSTERLTKKVFLKKLDEGIEMITKQSKHTIASDVRNLFDELRNRRLSEIRPESEEGIS